MVSSLVSLQARRAEGAEARDMLLDVQHRIQAIARIHRQLYTGDSFQDANMRDYLVGMAQDLAGTFSSETVRRDVRVVADDAYVSASTAVTLGVLVNELVSNACKYAYHPEQAGEVRIIFTAEGQGFRLAVEDDGIGMASSMDSDCATEATGIGKGTGIGSQIVQSMAKTLKASVTYASDGKGLRVDVFKSGES
jgi:two-component sensor histidine kinase